MTWLAALALTCAGMVMASGDSPPQAQPTDAKAEPAATPAPATAPASASAPAAAPVSNPKEAAIREQVQAFAKAFNVHDVEALTELLTADAVVVEPSGSETRGQSDIGMMYAEELENVPGVKLECTIESIRFLTADVARVEGMSRLSSGTGDANEFTRFSVLTILQEGKWRLAEIREYAAPGGDITPYERLKELEWMVGDWVDESGDNKVSSSIRWADNKSFLIRTYSIEIQGEKASSGTMFIGWDPQTTQIKSWVFSSEGGHGEGLWTRTAENQWIVKAQGTRHDGQPNSATQIHTILNKDVVKSSSIDRIIGGQLAPDIADVVMVRKPALPHARLEPQPAATGKPEK
ncbi:YybH family protein [Singulisphaera sp. GP187]|uniref:YybH family protein n=1 Tax=Singulisphaera sp. GP187 TaxID=1882752 RepID=UPI0020B163CD|nr:nuclear transport factor 2 family protein [Singulisphaera sp. GP187]